MSVVKVEKHTRTPVISNVLGKFAAFVIGKQICANIKILQLFKNLFVLDCQGNLLKFLNHGLFQPLNDEVLS